MTRKEKRKVVDYLINTWIDSNDDGERSDAVIRLQDISDVDPTFRNYIRSHGIPGIRRTDEIEAAQ